MKRLPHTVRYAIFAAFLLLAGYGWHDYFYGLHVLNAGLVQIADDPQQADGKILVLEVESDFSAWSWVPDGWRRFFYLQTRFCPLNPDGTPLVNEDAPAACFSEENAGIQRGKSHVREKSLFQIPFYTKPSRFSGERLFLRSISRQHGLWFKLKLQGALLMPPVESRPVFLDFQAWCANAPTQCKASFGQAFPK